MLENSEFIKKIPRNHGHFSSRFDEDHSAKIHDAAEKIALIL